MKRLPDFPPRRIPRRGRRVDPQLQESAAEAGPREVEVLTGEVRFGVGQTVRHKLFGYRGVIFDVDLSFLGTDDWYEKVAGSRPPKDRPWYHVLVHEAEHTTYVAERNLEVDPEDGAIEHPLLDQLFSGRQDGFYLPVQGIH